MPVPIPEQQPLTTNPLAGLQRRGAAQRSVLFPKGPVALHAMLTGVGREVREGGGYDLHGLKRGKAEFALLQHTFAGRGQLQYEGQHHDIRPGQTMLLHFPHDHRYRLVEGEAWDFFWICLNGAEAMRLWRQATSRLGPVVELSGSVLTIAASICAAALDDTLEGPGRASSFAYQLAAALVDEASASPGADRHRPPPVQRAIDLVRDDVGGGVDVERLAEAAGLSRWHFTRLFSSSEGVSPAEYITRQRMKRVAALLQQSVEPIKTIAYRCGYDDPSYFAKVFKRCFYVSPREFRDHRRFRDS